MELYEAANKILIKTRLPMHIKGMVQEINESSLAKFTTTMPEDELDQALNERSYLSDNKRNKLSKLFYKPSSHIYGAIECIPDNPGKGVYELLRSIYLNHTNESENSILSIVDNILKAEGDVIETFQESILLYLTRRLILFTISKDRYIRKNKIQDPSFLRKNVLSFLCTKTNIDSAHHGLLLELLLKTPAAKRKDVPQSLKRRLFNKAKDTNLNCYLCGRELDYVNSDRENSAIIEHIWPHALGGASIESNLKISCDKCSQKKETYLDAPDMHYENICLITDETDPHFICELNHRRRLTLLSKNQNKCSICDTSADIAGTLFISRSDPGDILHYFNSTTACNQHRRQ